MIEYTVTSVRPLGPMYHGPDALSERHLTNSIRGIRTAKSHHCVWIDNDYMTTKDGVIVCSHSFGLMEKEHFRAAGVPMLPIDRLTWLQVRQLTGPNGYKVQRLEVMMAMYARLGVGVALELKGDSREGYRLITEQNLDHIIAVANHFKVRMYMKGDSRKRRLRQGLAMARARGVWTRYNYSPVFREPTIL